MIEKEKRDLNLKQRINEKIEELDNDLKELESFEIPELDQFKGDIKLKAACERYFEKIVEGIISIAFLMIRLKNLSSPESEEHAFVILAKNNIISEEFAKRLKDAKDMRNRIIHNYITIDDTIVYHAIGEEIIRDATEFLDNIKNRL